MPEHDTTLTRQYLYDRSRVTTDWQCPRKRYWQYEFGGTGVVPTTSPLELYMGTTLHDGLAAIAHEHLERGTADIDLIATTARKQMLEALLPQTSGEIEDCNFAYEQAALVEGLLRGFYRHAWPRLLEQYPQIVLIEREMVYEHDGKTFMSRPDLVLANEQELVYVEYKSTSSKKEGWVNSWGTAIQLHSTIKAIEATTGQRVDRVIVQGLYKGYESYGKQSSLFCYAYRRAGNPPFQEEVLSYEYKAGLKRYPTWELEGGVARWVQEMPDVVLAEQFPQTPPIFVREDLIAAFFAQRAVREQEIELCNLLLKDADEEATRMLLDTAYPQRFDQCIPSFGKPCPYRMLCHGHHGADPYAAGFVAREPHHDLEMERFKEGDSAE